MTRVTDGDIFYSRMYFTLGLLVMCFCIMAWAQTLEVFEPPIVMHDDIEFQWGSHTFSYLLEGETGLALEKVAEGMAAPLELDVIVHDDGRLKDLERLRPCHDTEAHYEQPQSKVHARIEDVPVCDTCQSQPPIVSA